MLLPAGIVTQCADVITCHGETITPPQMWESYMRTLTWNGASRIKLWRPPIILEPGAALVDSTSFKGSALGAPASQRKSLNLIQDNDKCFNLCLMNSKVLQRINFLARRTHSSRTRFDHDRSIFVAQQCIKFIRPSKDWKIVIATHAWYVRFLKLIALMSGKLR